MTEISTYSVRGMTCDHCVGRVRYSLSGLDGVSAVMVDLVPGGDSAVTVSSARPLERHSVRSAISSAGYRLAS
jgi:copper chaperone CopZ